MPAGLSSLVMQSQAFFTVLIAAMFLNEKVRRHNIIGIAVAVLGLALIGWGAKPGSVPILGFALTLCSALCWAFGNIIIKGFGKVDMVALVVWGALIPPIPFFVLSWLVEGPARIHYALANISVVGIGAVLYLAFISTNVGFTLWGRLLSKHPVSKIAPLSLLIPVIGLVSSWLMLGEHMTLLQWISGAIVVAGLAMNIFGMKWLVRLARR
jgi:O-acetylserine/cysteine efflux transporter